MIGFELYASVGIKRGDRTMILFALATQKRVFGRFPHNFSPHCLSKNEGSIAYALREGFIT